MFLAEGAQVVAEAVRADDVIGEVFATPAAMRRHADLVGTARAAGIPVNEVSVKAAAALSETVTPSGLVATCRTVDVSLTAALERRPALVVGLVAPNDPGNAGTIVRTADAAGAAAVVFAGDAVDVYNGKCVRASAGSIFHLDVVAAHPPGDLLAAARNAGYRVLAAAGQGPDELFGTDLTAPTVWLFGNEAHGLPADVLTAADTVVRIPIYGRAESLNVASAAAICLYATARAHRPLER